MGPMASQITSLTIVYSTVYSGSDQRKRQRSASLAFVRGFHQWPVNSPHKGPVTQKMFPFDDVIMLHPYIWERVVLSIPIHQPSTPPTPTALVPVKFLEMQRGKLQVSPKHKETQAMSIYLGIYRIALFWIQFRQMYLVERICICICIWIDVFVFVFVFESKLKKIFVFVFGKSKFLYLYLYLYLIKRIWPQPCALLNIQAC